jgi:hypothetical protein
MPGGDVAVHMPEISGYPGMAPRPRLASNTLPFVLTRSLNAWMLAASKLPILAAHLHIKKREGWAAMAS